MPSTRPPIGESLASPTAAARRLDRDDVPAREVARDLGGDGRAVDAIQAGSGGRAAPFALRLVRAALADDRETTVLEHAQLTHDSVAATVRAPAARAEPEAVALHPQRVLQLERLHGRRQRVRHGDVHAARALGAGARTLPPADRL